MKMKNLLPAISVLFACALGVLYSGKSFAQLNVTNPSFEGTPPGNGITPAPWVLCNGSTPDTQPGAFTCTLAPSNGVSYLGMLGKGSAATNETCSQTLSSPMVSGTTYQLKYDYAYTTNYYALLSGSYGGKGTLGIYAGFSDCALTQLLGTSPTATTAWQTATLTFTANANYTSITLSSVGPDKTNILVDNLRPILIASVPISLLRFTAKADNNGVQLAWATATEHNNNYFIVERSTDGISFLPISTNIKGAGNSDIVKEYLYTDQSAQATISGVLYYRLKQVDFDGQYDYTNIISLNPSKPFGELIITPQPVQNGATVVLNSGQEETIQISLYDMLGRVIKNQQQPVVEGANTIEIDLSGQETGIYYLVLTNADNESQRLKLVKQ